jgi:hypothetical protein
MTVIDLTCRIIGVHAVRIKFAQKDTPNHPLILLLNDCTGLLYHYTVKTRVVRGPGLGWRNSPQIYCYEIISCHQSPNFTLTSYPIVIVDVMYGWRVQ